jgi:hypothetical protein
VHSKEEFMTYHCENPLYNHKHVDISNERCTEAVGLMCVVGKELVAADNIVMEDGKQICKVHMCVLVFSSPGGICGYMIVPED